MTHAPSRAPAAILLLAAALVMPEPAEASLFGTLFAGSPPPTLGVHEGSLAPCPATPNCVASGAADAGHAIAAFAFAGDPAIAMSALADAIRAQPGASIVTSRADYLHAEFTSAVFGFVDDAEFLLDAKAGVIHIRSAARLGISDLGVNRARTEVIRAAYAARKS
jgi:uncharacterized protein (DUF1499 family)